jgi:hypothetical protein
VSGTNSCTYFKPSRGQNFGEKYTVPRTDYLPRIGRKWVQEFALLPHPDAGGGHEPH